MAKKKKRGGTRGKIRGHRALFPCYRLAQAGKAKTELLPRGFRGRSTISTLHKAKCPRARFAVTHMPFNFNTTIGWKERLDAKGLVNR